MTPDQQIKFVEAVGTGACVLVIIVAVAVMFVLAFL